MQNKYLVINAGSSSLKFSLYDIDTQELLVNGYVEKIGNDDSFYTLKFNGGTKRREVRINNHTDAIKIMLKELVEMDFVTDLNEIAGVGHRVLHGGEIYGDSTLIDEKVINDIKDLTKFGPLHHPGEIAGIESMINCLPDVPQVAVFDTAFHHSIPKENFTYSVPYEWYVNNGVRKYGFHGTSHKYITYTMKDLLNNEEPNLIICHIGSGASITAIKKGKSYDTSMGLTPVDGLMMGTRCGSIDPSILEYICNERGLTIEEITQELNKQSGLIGITGRSDLRDVQELSIKEDDDVKTDSKTNKENAILALKMYKKSIINYIAQYYFELQGDVDAIVFTAGVGENAIGLRKDIIDAISPTIGIKLDENKNNAIAGYKDIKSGIITTNDSSVPVYVIPTDEEKMILLDTKRIVDELKSKEIENSEAKVYSKKM